MAKSRVQDAKVVYIKRIQYGVVDYILWSGVA